MFESMKPRWPAKWGSVICLLSTIFLLQLPGALSVCKDLSPESDCICLNDVSCNCTVSYYQGCSCENGEEDSFEGIARKAKAQNGTIESLYIYGQGIESLDPLIGSLVAVKHHLVLTNTRVRSLEALDTLQSVKNLAIISNDQLTNISGFADLKIVSGNLVIASNSRLADIIGLSALTEVRGDVEIQFNTALVSITGFKRLREIRGGLLIFQNKNLSHLKDFKNLEVINGSLSINGNANLTSLEGLGNLTRIGGSLIIVHNSVLPSLHGLGGDLMTVGGSLTISKNAVLKSINALGNKTNVVDSIIIENNAGDVAVDMFLSHWTTVTGDLKLSGIVFMPSTLGNLEKVGRDLFISGSSISSPLFSSLQSVGNHMTLVDNFFNSLNESFVKLRKVGGNIVVQGNRFFGAKNIFTFVETVGHNVDINSNEIHWIFPDEHNMLSSLRSICGSAPNGTCGLQIRNNTGYHHIKGFQNLTTFNGSISIVRNEGLQRITGFNQLTSLVAERPYSGTSHDGLMGDGVFGALTIGSNSDLRSVESFRSLEKVEGNLLISGNPLLDQIILKSLTYVEGSTQIFANGENLTDILVSERLPFSEPGCRSRRNTIMPSNLNSANHGRFVSKLEKNECIIEKVIPTLVGIGLISSTVLVTFLLLRYLVLRRRSMPNYRRRISAQELRNMFTMHVFSVADVLSDVGFITNMYILWEGRDPAERDSRLLVIGILSSIVIVGVQLYGAISVYIGLNRKLPGQKMSLLQALQSKEAMKKHDWLLLFPGLLVLEADVVKHLPWDRLLFIGSEGNELQLDYFTQVAMRATMIEDSFQIVLQVFSIYVLEASDGWAITGAIASLTLSVTHFIVKTAFSWDKQETDSDDLDSSASSSRPGFCKIRRTHSI